MIHHHQRQHGLGDRGGADAHAGVVPALGDDFGGVALDVDGPARQQDGAGGLDGDRHFQVLPGADAAQHAAGLVALEALRRQRITMRAALVGHGGKAGADLHALDGVDAHHGVGDIGIQLVEQRLAQAHRHPARRDAQARAAGVAGLAQRFHIGLQRRDVGHRGEEGVVGHVFPGLEGDGDLTDLRHAAAELGAEFFLQPFLGHGAGGHHGRGQPRRGAAAAARVADAVFAPIGVVGMAGAEGLQDLPIVLAALVGVPDEQADRRAGGLALVDAGEDFHRIGFVALGDELGGAGAAAVQVGLDVGFAQAHAGRAAVDHAADGRAVGFTEVGDREEVSEGVAAHGASLSQSGRASTQGQRALVQRSGAPIQAPLLCAAGSCVLVSKCKSDPHPDEYPGLRPILPIMNRPPEVQRAVPGATSCRRPVPPRRCGAYILALVGDEHHARRLRRG